MSYQCLRTDGNGYCSILDANQAGLKTGLSDFMIEARVRLTVPVASQSNDYAFYFNKVLAGVGYQIYTRRTNERLNVYIDDGPNNATDWCASSYLDDLRWHPMIIVCDRSSATGMKIFIDGAEVTYGAQGDPTGVGNLDNAGDFQIGRDTESLIDEPRVWNFGYGGLPTDYATYIAWRAAGRNVFKDISEYNSGSWNLYADAERTDKHDEAGTVAGLVVGMKYGYVTVAPHTLDYQGGTLADNGVFTATHTTGTIASGDANDHVRRVGLTGHWKFDGDYLDEGSNDNDLTASGTGNTFLGYSLKKVKIISPYSVW